jgi:hypothetical protein
MYYLGDAKETHKSTMNNARIDLTETNCKISKHFAEVFLLPLPEWWTLQYPSGEIPL